MTLEEMRDKIKEYESKWGKLGHTNIMKPEKYTIEHSGLSKGETKMPNMTNDFYAFRRKVAEGKEKNKIAHTATINITDLNKKYFEQITTDGTLIHASTNSDYGKKYYQKIDKYYADGSARYFWSPQEWEAYQKEKGQDAYRKQQQATTNANTAKTTSGSAKSQDDIEAQKRYEYENEKKNTNIVNQIMKAEKEGGAEAAADVILKSDGYKRIMNIFTKMAEKGYDVHAIKSDDIDKELGKGTSEKARMITEYKSVSKENRDKVIDIIQEQMEKDFKDIVANKANKAKQTSGGAKSQDDIEAQKRYEYENEKKERQRKLDIAKEKNKQADEDTSAENERKSKVAIATEKNRQADLAEEEREKNKGVTSQTGKAKKEVNEDLVNARSKEETKNRNKTVKQNEIDEYNSKTYVSPTDPLGTYQYKKHLIDRDIEKYAAPDKNKVIAVEDTKETPHSSGGHYIPEKKENNKSFDSEYNKLENNYNKSIEDLSKSYKALSPTQSPADKTRINKKFVSDVSNAANLINSPEGVKIEVTDSGNNFEAYAPGVKEKKEKLEKTYEKAIKDKQSGKISEAELQDILQEVNDKSQKLMKENNEITYPYLMKLYKYLTPAEAKHSAINEEDSVMSEYRAFKQRANEGAKRNRLSHSAVISPADLNAKYYQDIEDHCFLVHASTQYGKGYYQKIEKFYPDGSTRYFYTPQEWEAYQKNKGQNNKPSVTQTHYLKPAGTNEKIEAYKKADQELKEKKANESAVKQIISPIKSLAKNIDKQWDAIVDTIEDGKSEEGKRLKDSSKALKKYFKKPTHKLKDADDIANEVLAKHGYKDYDDMLNKEYFDKYPEVVDKKSLTEYTDEEKAAGKEFLNKTVKIANEIKEAQAAEAEKQEKAYELAEEADKQVDIFDDIHKEINLLNSTKRADLADALGVKSLSEKDIINVFMPEINEMEDKFDAGDYNDTYGVEFFQAIIDGMKKFRAAYREARTEIGMD